jgi:very-short-patch-repair endonuclease
MNLPDPNALLHVSPILLARAREFRHPLTPAEAKVWAKIRNNQLGFKMRRQHPLWRFIADFYCASAKLVIEIDGDTHAAEDQAAYDAARTAWLEARGYVVVRFHNDDIHRNLSGVLSALQARCAERASLHPTKPGKQPPSSSSKAPLPLAGDEA